MRFSATVAGVCGINTRALLAYLLRDDLISEKEANDLAKDYSDLDYKLIACHPFIHKDHLALVVAYLEKARPRKKVANVNTDNTALFLHLKTCFEGTSWWTHVKVAARTKDSRYAWFALEETFQPSSAFNWAYGKNKADI